MNNSFRKATLFTISIFLFFGSNAALFNTYQKFHQDIQSAMAEEDVKKAKAIVKELLPILEEDIEYTRSVMSEEDDEFFLEQLSVKYKRQLEIKQQLEQFAKSKKVDTSFSDESMSMVRELRRLSSKPRNR